MGKGLQPDIFVKSIYSLDINWLKERGIKGVLLDIDNTLITHKQKIPDDKVIELIKIFSEKWYSNSNRIKCYKKKGGCF